jgi:hypothetical protein
VIGRYGLDYDDRRIRRGMCHRYHTDELEIIGLFHLYVESDDWRLVCEERRGAVACPDPAACQFEGPELRFEAVTQARFGQQVSRSGRVGFEFAP